MKVFSKVLIVGLLSGSFVGCAHDGSVKDAEKGAKKDAKAAPAPAQAAPKAADDAVAAAVAQLRDSLVTIKAGTLAMGDAANKTQSPVHSVQLRSLQ